ncbi:hypothetical protein [Massilia sp. Dwa41.01b]|uniref:hypothetical protein n=1 Tax=Massilia sp. Dwa41.01b TaxID=2709302 RepID=UPI0035A67670
MRARRGRGATGGHRRSGRCRFQQPSELLLVIAVLDHEEFARLDVGKTLAVGTQGALRGEHGEAAAHDGLALDPAIDGALVLRGRVRGLQHRVAEVGDPGQPGQAVQAERDQVRGGDREGRPDHLRLVAADHRQPGRHGAKPPRDETVGHRHRLQVAPLEAKVAFGIERERAAHDQVGRDRGQLRGVLHIISARVGRQHHRFPAMAAEEFRKAQRPLDAAAARLRREMESNE